MLSLDRPVARVGPWLIVGVLVLVTLITGLRHDAGRSDARLGGDFPSFYAAGQLVVEGSGDLLYDATVQRAAQADLLDDGRFLYFAYPPYTAAAYAPLATLPYGTAFALHTVLALAALVASLVAIRPLAGRLLDGSTRLGVATVLALACYPVLRSVMGGQNATFSLLGLCLVARFLHDDNDIGAGLAASAMLFKPQFGLIVIALLVVGRRWRATAWAGIAAAGLFAIGAMVTGGDWVTTWLDAVSTFGEQNLEVNGPLMIAAWGWFGNLLSSNASALAIAGTLVAVAAVPVIIAVSTDRWRPIPWYALAPLVVVAAPSALYYDATLLLLTIVMMMAMTGVVPVAVLAIVATTWSQAFALSLGWSPLFIPIAAAALAFSWAAVGGSTGQPLSTNQ